jgi:hypothetical protein
VDYYGDGICCGFNNGFYKLYNINNPALPILSGGEFGAYDDRAWGVKGVATGTSDPADRIGLEVFPNPVIDQLHLAFELPKESSVAVSVVDMLGRTMQHFPTIFYPQGEIQLDLPLENLSNGLYFVQLQIGNESIVRKFVRATE